MKKAIIFALMILSANMCLAQNKLRTIVLDEIKKGLIANSDTKNLKDSIALYTFAIQIEVKHFNNGIAVKRITVNDNIANVIFKNFDFLKRIDYKPIISKSHLTKIVIPIGLILANYEKEKLTDRKITINGLSKNIEKLFNYSPENITRTEKFIYLPPIIIYADKAVYD